MNFLQDKSYAEESDRLKEEARVMLLKLENPMDQLELIDIFERLGVDHHFGPEISNILESVYKSKDTLKRNNLYVTALEFRLLRHHGYDVSSGINLYPNYYLHTHLITTFTPTLSLIFINFFF